MKTYLHLKDKRGNMGIPFINGERLYLRALEEADADGPYATWFNDEEVCLGNSHHVFPFTRESALSYIHYAFQTHDELILAIVLRDGDRHIGNMALQHIHPIYNAADFSILIGDKSAWGKGYASEAGRLLFNHGFSSLNLHRIASGTFENNNAFKKLALTLGMKEEGRRRSAIYKEGRFIDIIEFGILETEYWKNQQTTKR
jgi:ribosomal-protein-alanine N-acetyltransferase